jgi:hypothetical protein
MGIKGGCGYIIIVVRHSVITGHFVAPSSLVHLHVAILHLVRVVELCKLSRKSIQNSYVKDFLRGTDYLRSIFL